ncbi:MAG: hypothetical protein JXR77_17945 [Lentisphaeria bacterium]|nr:hypothetical protein [Lentisphaeria bacterium]
MSWQYVGTGLILLLALVFVVRCAVRMVRGQGTGACAFCPRRDPRSGSCLAGTDRRDERTSPPPDAPPADDGGPRTPPGR